MHAASLLQFSLDLLGTIVFAMSGASRGVERKLDLFGVLVLAFVTAVSGGIMRDLLIGAVPPESVSSWRNLAAATASGAFVFRYAGALERLRQPVLLFDAIGLGLFAVSGTQKAIDAGVNWPVAAALGMLTGIGGGIVRDVLTARVPVVLHSEIYAVAALAGALIVVGGHALALPGWLYAPAGIGACVFLRVMALYRGWRLPIASSHR